MRRNYGPFEYVWFLEFQRRGAPHLHLLLTLEAPDPFWPEMAEFVTEERRRMAELWCRAMKLVPGTNLWDNAVSVHRHPRSWEQIKKIDGAARYITAYASKPKQKSVPDGFQNVGRFWGCSRGVRETLHPVTGCGVTTEADLREILLYLNHRAQGWEVIPKHLWGFDTSKLEKDFGANGIGEEAATVRS